MSTLKKIVKRNTLIALLLLCTTLLLIVGLQLYSLVSGYKTEEEIFKRKINDGLKSAVSQSFDKKRELIIEELKIYLNDESKVIISCRWNAKTETTIFTINDVDTTKSGQHKVSFSKIDIPERLDSLSSKAKRRFIESFSRDVLYELKKGAVWYYTQNIGDFLNKHYFEIPIPLDSIKVLYSARLASDFIFVPFELNTNTPEKLSTQKVKMSIYRTHLPEHVQAFFENPFIHILRKQALVLIGSLFLVITAIITFTYMLKTLLTQQKLNGQKDQLITNITHELKTPITTIQMTAEAMKSFELTHEEQQNYLSIILQNTGSLDNITTEILNEARVGQLKPQLQKFWLQELVSAIHSSKIEIVNEVSSDIEIDSDPKLLKKILQNLIDNAAKYNISSQKEVVISALKTASSFTICISDNGVGIPDSYKKGVFERFFRIPTHDTHDVRGYGIGLSYVKQVTELLGGKVGLRDNSPQGSIFTLTFPK